MNPKPEYVPVIDARHSTKGGHWMTGYALSVEAGDRSRSMRSSKHPHTSFRTRLTARSAR